MTKCGDSLVWQSPEVRNDLISKPSAENELYWKRYDTNTELSTSTIFKGVIRCILRPSYGDNTSKLCKKA